MRTFGKNFFPADKKHMPRKHKNVNKQDYKHTAGCCRICKNPAYEVLDVHRIKPGTEGGKYTYANVVALCANCHRLVHDEKKIIIDRWYPSTAGNLLRILENGVERFV